MIQPIQDIALYEQAIKKFGMEAQFGVAQEECAELIRAISKFQRHRGIVNTAKLAEEIADVQIMLNQLRLFVGDELLGEAMKRKMERLFKMIHN